MESQSPKLSVPALAVGVFCLGIGIWMMAADSKLKSMAIHAQAQVTALRADVCESGGKYKRKYNCFYPTLTYLDAEGRKRNYNVNRSWEQGHIQEGQYFVIYYLPNGPSPDDDKVFLDDGAGPLFGIILSLVGFAFLWCERKALMKTIDAKSAASAGN